MRILLLCGDNYNQVALANKVFKKFNLTGIVVEEKQRYLHSNSFKVICIKLTDRVLFNKIHTAWRNLMQYYKKSFPSFPDTNVLRTININSDEVINFANEINPDLIMVSGTSLMKKSFFQIKPPRGIINLHTGLSPYVKGGPNCTNWCIANDEFHLIGNTVMWLDAGIDSGNIITTELITFSGDESLIEIHMKVMECAHDLYIRSIELLERNYEKCPSIKQGNIAKGNLYLTKMWNSIKKRQLLKNIKGNRFKKIILSDEYKQKQSQLKLVILQS